MDIGPDVSDLVAAASLLIEYQRGSESILEREVGIGFTRACQLMRRLEQLGIVGEPRRRSGLRPVLVDRAGKDAALARIRASA